MAPYGCRSVSVRAGEDHDGDPVIFVDVDYDLSQTPLELGVTGPLGTALRDKLWGAGEFRFPHIWHHFDEHQKVNTRRRAKA